MEQLNINPLEETIEWAEQMEEAIVRRTPFGGAIDGFDQAVIYQKTKEHINMMILRVNEGECASDPEEHIHYLYLALFHLEQIENLLKSEPGPDWTVDDGFIQNEINYIKLRLFDYVMYLDQQIE